MKPVYSLKENEKFVAENGEVWTVSEIEQPPNLSDRSHIGETPKAYTIRAVLGARKRTFYYYGSKLLDIRD